MKYASCIGRVGALAVALGIGTVISGTPGVAWGAPEDAGLGAASSDSSSQSSGSPAPGDSATSPAAVSADDPSAGPPSGSAGDPGESASADDGPSTGGMKIESSGGAHTSTKEREAVDDKDGARTADGGSADKPSTKKRKPQSDSKPAHEPRQRVVTSVPETGVARTGADPEPAAAAKVSDPAPEPPADPVRPANPVVVQRPPAVVDVPVAASASAPIVKAVAPQPVTEVAKPSVPVRLVTGLLAGLGGSATGGDGPAVPVDSPAALAVAAWSRSRMAQGKTVEEAAPAAQVFSGQAVAAAGPVPTVLSPVSVGRDPVGVATFGSRVYVANQFDKTVSVIDTGTGAVVSTVPVAGSATGVAVNADGSRAYVTLKGAAKVAVINTATNKVLTTISTGAGPEAVAVSPNGSRVYVSNTGGSTVSVIDAATNKVVASVTVGSQPTGLAVSANGSRLYVTTKATDQVAVVDTATNKVLTKVAVGDAPVDVAVRTGDGRAYVVNSAGSVSVVNTATNTVVGSPIAVGVQPTGVAVSGDGTRVYVANGDDTVSVIDTASNTVVQTVAADPAPESGAHDIAVSADGTRIYMTDMKDRVLRVISLANADIAAPTVSVTAPTGTVSGTVSLSATASDNVGVVGVQFLVDNNPVGAEDVSSPYGVSFNTATVSNGVHTVTARARDAAGNTATSSAVTLTVANDTIAPTVAVTAPTGTVSGTVSLSATASDNVGVVGVQFLVDNNPVGGEDTSSPYGVSFNTTTVANGVHTVAARARDAAGNTTTSSAVTLTVANGANHPPEVTPSLFSHDPLTGTVTGTVRLSDADGDPLAYTMVGTPAHGALVFNTYSGAYTYTPSHAARVAADQTTGTDTDSFSVTVSDGTNTTTQVVTVPLSPAKLTVDPAPISVGAGVSGIAFRGNYAIVANQNTGIVTVIDTTTNSVVGTVPAGAGATSVATTYNGTFGYIALKDENAVSVINTYSITGEKWIPVGAQPWGIVAAPNYQSVYVTNSGANTVTIIDTLNKNVVGAVVVGNNPMGVAISADSARLYVANKGSNTVSIVDTASRSVVATVPVGTNPVGVAVNSAGTRAYVSHLNGTVSVLDTSTASPTVIASVPVGPQPYSLALSPDGSLYVVNSNDTMSVIDTGTNTLVRTVALDTSPETGMHFVALDTYGRVYLSDAADGVVRSVSGSPSASTTVSTTSTAITVGTNPSLVTVSGNRTYVLNSGSNTVSVIDSGSKQVINTVPIRAGAIGLTATPAGDRVYVAYYDTVSVIDAATRLVRVDVPIPDLCAGVCYGSTVGLTDLAISPDGARVYVIQEYATDIGPWGSVAVIDTSTDTLVYNEFSAYVTDLEFTADGSRLFYTQGDYRFVHVSDFSTGQTPVITVSTPEGGWTIPRAIGIRPDGLRAYVVVVDSDWYPYSGLAKYVVVLDTDRSSATYNTQIGHIAVPYGAQDVAISPDSRRLYVTLADGKTVEVIDTATHAVLGYFTRPGSGPMAVGPDGTLYFTDPTTGKTHAVTVGNVNL